MYVCYNCSGVHRGFGVQISFIRSLTMDNINLKQQKFLKLGGNKRFKEFMKAYNLNSDPTKYKTKAAEFYRYLLKSLVEGTDCNIKRPEIEEGRKIVPGFDTHHLISKKKNNNGILNTILELAKEVGDITKTTAENFAKKFDSILGISTHTNIKKDNEISKNVIDSE